MAIAQVSHPARRGRGRGRDRRARNLLSMQPAQARIPRFCVFTVTANFYRTLTDVTENAATINYWVQLQNRAGARHIRVSFSGDERGLVLGGGNVTVHSALGHASSNDTPIGNYGQISVLLGSLRVNNPAGSRGLASMGVRGLSATDTQKGLPRFTWVTCTQPQ